jgi:hypothetical protein
MDTGFGGNRAPHEFERSFAIPQRHIAFGEKQRESPRYGRKAIRLFEKLAPVILFAAIGGLATVQFFLRPLSAVLAETAPS